MGDEQIELQGKDRAHLTVNLFNELSWRTGHRGHCQQHCFHILLKGMSLSSGFKSFTHVPDRWPRLPFWAAEREYKVQGAISNFQGTLRDGYLQPRSFPLFLSRRSFRKVVDRTKIWEAEASEDDKRSRSMGFGVRERSLANDLGKSHLQSDPEGQKIRIRL